MPVHQDSCQRETVLRYICHFTFVSDINQIAILSPLESITLDITIRGTSQWFILTLKKSNFIVLVVLSVLQTIPPSALKVPNLSTLTYSSVNKLTYDVISRQFVGSGYNRSLSVSRQYV